MARKWIFLIHFIFLFFGPNNPKADNRTGSSPFTSPQSLQKHIVQLSVGEIKYFCLPVASNSHSGDLRSQKKSPKLSMSRPVVRGHHQKALGSLQEDQGDLVVLVSQYCPSSTLGLLCCSETSKQFSSYHFQLLPKDKLILPDLEN